MAKRKAAIPRTHRKVTLSLAAEVDEKLSVQARRERKSRSVLANELLGSCLRQLVISDRSRQSGEAETAA